MYTLPGSGNPNFHLANSKDFLSGDKGIWTKITDTLDWIADNTPLPRMRMINSDRDMTITMGYKDPYGVRKGLGSSVFAISLKDNPEKARGIRGPLIHYEEDGLFDNLEKAWNVNLKAVEDGDSSFGYMLAGGCLTENNYVWTKDGRLVKINNLKLSDGIVGYNGKGSSPENINWFKKPSLKECVRVLTARGNVIECSVDHPLMSYLKGTSTFKRADEVKVGDELMLINNIDLFGKVYSRDVNKSMLNDLHLYDKSTSYRILRLFIDKVENGTIVIEEDIETLILIKLNLIRFGIDSTLKDKLYVSNEDWIKLNNSSSSGQTSIFTFREDYQKGDYFKNVKTLECFNTDKVVEITNIGKQLVYNLNTSITNTYLGNNFITGNTGGTEGASFEGSEKLFYSPSAYNVMGVPNVYDRNADGSTECGFFWGAYMSRNKCYDLEVGEPDVIKALIEILEARYIVKYSSTDMMAIVQKKAEDPITPQEAVMRTSGTVFPVSDLKEHLENISIYKEKFVSEHYIGDLVRTAEGEVRFVPDDTKIPLRSYDKIPNDRTGGIEIFEMPRKNNDGLIQHSRYIAGIDPIDADNGTSLFSIIVMDLFTDRIVAEYSGRPRFAEDAYDIALRMLDFYNAIANYEQNLKGLFSYFDKHNKLYRLCDTPQILKDMDLAKGGGYGNNAKGTRANKEVNKWGRLLQAEWQKKFDDGSESKSLFNEDGESRKLKLHTLRGIAYIEECIKWTEDGNFDRVSAGGMLMILREDRYKVTESAKINESSGSNLAHDQFFNKNYNKTMKW